MVELGKTNTTHIDYNTTHSNGYLLPHRETLLSSCDHHVTLLQKQESALQYTCFVTNPFPPSGGHLQLHQVTASRQLAADDHVIQCRKKLHHVISSNQPAVLNHVMSRSHVMESGPAVSCHGDFPSHATMLWQVVSFPAFRSRASQPWLGGRKDVVRLCKKAEVDEIVARVQLQQGPISTSFQSHDHRVRVQR